MQAFSVVVLVQTAKLCECVRRGTVTAEQTQHWNDRPFTGVNFAAKLVAASQKCEDGTESLGHYDTVQQCALAVWGEGISEFSYGSQGCFPAPGNCAPGWKHNANVDQYTVDLSGNATEAWEFQMVKLAAAVYRHAEPGGGWKQAAWAPQTESSQMGLYVKGEECVLSFGGTSHGVDVLADMKVVPYGACGEQFHRGFVTNVVGEIQRSQWHHLFVPILKGPICNSKVTVVGHSMGGAMATVFAVCANSRGGLRSIGVPGAIDLHVKGLYTIGSPETAYRSTRNGKSKDGCFKGSRIYAETLHFYDPVPLSARLFGFVHPHENAVRYRKENNHVKRTEFKCGHGSGIFGGAVFGTSVRRLPHAWSSGVSAPYLHSSTKYVEYSARIWR